MLQAALQIDDGVKYKLLLAVATAHCLALGLVNGHVLHRALGRHGGRKFNLRTLVRLAPSVRICILFVT